MGSKRIQLIIGLMTLALLGSIALQVYWIGSNIRLNEEQFDKNIYQALNRVADKLQFYENAVVMDALKSSQQNAAEWINAKKNVRKAAKYLENGYSKRKNISKKEDEAEQDTSTLEELAIEDNATFWEYAKVSQMVNNKPLSERINLAILDQSLKDELNSRGIAPDYQYGIFSKARNNYIISNGHFIVSDALTNEVTNIGDLKLEKSYNVSLFQQDIESPGYLSVYFANRASLVLGSVWKTLIASILFTGIILFCFVYTMSIIFRQKKISEMKTDFINNMTHEFKTPIATISLAADAITSPMILGNTDKIKRFVEIIREENRRMNSQVERVLQMAMIDKRDFDLKVGEMNMHDIIRKAAENFSLQVEQRNGTLTMDFHAQHPVIEGDATHIASIIHNLLDNANKYSPDQPVIQIITRDVPNGIEITIKDHGIGIGNEARKHIFDKFYRVHTGNVHDVKGFGLGLSYVKAIMTAHKGLVDVKSEPGKGSSFILTFQHHIGIVREG